MAMKSRPTPVNDGIPRCSMCRRHQEDTFATQSLQMSPDGEWDDYCDVCGKAMASVIRDGYYHWDPVIRRLPTPPAGKPTPAPVPPPAPKPAPPPPVQKPAPAPKPVPRAQAPIHTNVTKVAREVEQEAAREAAGHDLLALLGWK